MWRGHARNRQSAMRQGTLLGVTALTPFRVCHHGLAAEFVERNVLGRVARRARRRHRGKYPLRIGHGPLQHLHAAHRSADNAKQRIDAEAVEQHRLRAHHVGNGHDRKIQPPWLAGGRVGRSRPGRAHAAADDVGADDEVTVDVERQPVADHVLPPSRLARHRMHVCDMLIERQRMADQNGIGALGVELAIGLVGDLERREIDAAVELQRLINSELGNLRRGVVELLQAILGLDRGTHNRLQLCHLITGPAARQVSRTELRPIKNPA